MKILMVSSDLNFPPIYGGRIRRYNLMKHLGRGNNLTLLCFIEAETETSYIESVKAFCESIVTVPRPHRKMILQSISQHLLQFPPVLLHYQCPEMKHHTKNLLEKGAFDVVLFEYWYMGQYIQKSTHCINVLDEVDVEFRRWQRLAQIEKNVFQKIKAWYLYQRVRRMELKIVRLADLVLTATSQDSDTLKKFLPNFDSFILPTCVDTSYFHPPEKELRNNNLIFVGSLAHLPNADAVLYFYREIFPMVVNSCPDVHLYIVGLYPPAEILKLTGPHITVTGFVEDIRPYVHKSSVFIAPLRFGSGIKGKVLEAMAMGIPVVTTQVGIEGIACIPERDVIIADSPKQMADAIISLLNNPVKRKFLKENGLKLVREKYTWEPAIASLQARLYEKVEKRRASL